MSQKKKLGQGVGLHAQTKEVILNVYNYMKEEAESGAVTNLKQVQKRVCEATGIGRTALSDIIKKEKIMEEGASFDSPTKKRKKNKPVTEIDGFDEAVIRRMIHNFHNTEKERVTMRQLHEKMVKDIAFKGSITSCRRIVRRLGFRWQRTQDNRKILIERHDIRSKRINYLRKIRQYREEERPIVYVDETYIHSSHTSSFSWDDNTNSTLHSPVAKGPRAIIVHAGGEQGFVDNALLMFKSGRKTGDYHHEMNSKNFDKWLSDKLITNLPPRSVIVVDNASYHDVQVNPAPTSNTNVSEMKIWLTERNITYPPSSLKPDLYDIIKIHKPYHKEFKLDAILAAAGHSVLRLPPYHPDLNPIEMVWGTVKNWVAQKNITFKLDDAMRLAEEKFRSITSQDWIPYCRKVKVREEEYFATEVNIDATTDSIIISTEDSDESEPSDDEENDIGDNPDV